jgi:hypothetical protein
VGSAAAGAGHAAIAAVGIGVVTAALSGIARELMTRAGRGGIAWMAGKRAGHRRLSAEAFQQTRVMAHAGGHHYEHEQWIDLAELDHRGFYYGVAESRTYVPLYGNGLVEIPEIDITCSPEPAPLDPDDELARAADDLLTAKVEDLRAEHSAAGRAFYDDPLVRLLSWQPPIDERMPLAVQAEPVGHQTYAAATALLRNDNGPLREKFSVRSRDFNNPIVHGALGVEVAVITSDEKLVLGHRGQAATDYRDQIVVSFGQGLHPKLDASSESDLSIDPWISVQRGLDEELGIQVDGRRTKFLALGAELTRMDPDLLGYIRVAQSSTEIQGTVLAGRARRRWEAQTLTFIDFGPDPVADLLGGPLRTRLTPATPMSLVFAISHVFGETQAQRALAR